LVAKTRRKPVADVRILKEIHERILTLATRHGDMALNSQILQLGAEISRLEKEQSRYVPTNLDLPSNWTRDVECRGFASFPYVRTDGFKLVQAGSPDAYYTALTPEGSFVTDSRGRKKSWKHLASAAHILNTDYPCKEK
jgi:hypothetical protein